MPTNFRSRLAAALAALRGRLPVAPTPATPPDLAALQRQAEAAQFAAAEALERARANLAAVQAAIQSRAG